MPILKASSWLSQWHAAVPLSDPYLSGSNLDVRDLSAGDKFVSSGPALDPSECVGSIPSNGRLYYTGPGGGRQACQVGAAEAVSVITPWSEARGVSPQEK